jgi:hypothetical protein
MFFEVFVARGRLERGAAVGSIDALMVFLPQRRVVRLVNILPPHSMVVCVADHKNQASRLDALKDMMQLLTSGG